MTMRILSLFPHILGPKFDPENRIRILRASQDPGLKAYLRLTGNRGSTDMDPDGIICVKLDDTGQDLKGLCLEELAHALQYINNGNVALESDNAERKARELEVARCLLDKADRLHLSDADREHYNLALIEYGCGNAT